MSDSPKRPESDPGDPITIAIVRAPDAGSMLVRFLGNVESIWVHWKAGRTHACTGEETCPDNLHREKTHWRGYCAAEFADSKRGNRWIPCVFELTAGFRQFCQDDNPRGQVWRVFRSAVTSKRDECRGTFVRQEDPKKLRVDIDVRGAVQRLYNCLWIQWDQPPPFGFRQQLTPTLVAEQCASLLGTADNDGAAELPRGGRRPTMAELERQHSKNGNGNGKKTS